MDNKIIRLRLSEEANRALGELTNTNGVSATRLLNKLLLDAQCSKENKDGHNSR